MKKVYLIATFVAIIAGIATFFFASQLSKNTKIKDAPTTPVVVALDEIKENTKLTAEMFEVKLYTTVSVAPGAASKIEDVVGKLNRFPIAKGEQVIGEKLFAYGSDSKEARLSYQLMPGEYAYTIDVDIVQGVAGFIGGGDFVDIIHTGTVGDAAAGGQIVTQIIMKDIKVLKIADYAANAAAANPDSPTPITTYGVVTLLLNEAQIIQLTQMQTVGRIRLALKPITTGQDTTDTGTTQAAETTTAAS